MPHLFSLTKKLSELKYIKPKTLEGLNAEGIYTVSDLLLYAPLRYEDRSVLRRAYQIRESGVLNTFAEVKSTSYFGPVNKRILKITLEECYIQKNENLYRPNTINLLCFNRNFMERYVHTGNRYYLFGTANRKTPSSVDLASFELHPALSAEDYGYGKILPIYPLNSLLSAKSVRNCVSKVYDEFQKDLTSPLDEDTVQKAELMDIKQAISALHYPSSISQAEKARRTLAANELYYLIKEYGTFGGREDDDIIVHPVLNDHEKKFISSLSFKLTQAQEEALNEIISDLDADFVMKRLLQGDVGSGKTIVSLIAAYHEILKGNQVVMMVPTELLCVQHYKNALALFENTGVNTVLLKGGQSAKERNSVLSAIRDKRANLVIGTHSLSGENIEFSPSLSLAIIDEEQRFGVEQRESFLKKNSMVNILTMSATPIPRSLAELLCGKANLSTITTLPSGRQPIITHLVSPNKRNLMFDFIKNEFEKGNQAYFVAPRINSTDDARRDVYDLETELTAVFPSLSYGVIHSKVNEKDKLSILEDFRTGKLKYIIATSVVEVGLDNPNATCMVIERADLFGLSTLHQLRGRVGRGNKQSFCFLVYTKNMTQEAVSRLKAMRDSTDGFALSESDANTRGMGDVFGTKQSGKSSLKFINLKTDRDLFPVIRNAVKKESSK